MFWEDVLAQRGGRGRRVMGGLRRVTSLKMRLDIATNGARRGGKGGC